MKKIVNYFFLLAVNLGFSDTITISKNGVTSNVEIIKSSFKFDNTEKKIYYKTTTNQSLKSLGYTDFDYVDFDKYRFQVFTIENAKQGCFVITKSKTKILAATINMDEENSEKTDYVFHILDNNYTIIESHYFNNTKSTKQTNLRGEIYGKIQFYFSDCDKMIKRIMEADKLNKEDNLYMLKIFDYPEFCNCE